MALFAPPVREFDGRKSLRSVVDALEKLRELDNLSDHEMVVIKTWPLELPDARRTGCVSVMRPVRPDGSIFVIFMPPSGEFIARSTLGERATYPIALLHEAKSDVSGNVELLDGRLLHAVDLKPTPFFKFTDIDDSIVRCAARYLRVEDQVYREVVPGAWWLDYQLVTNVRIFHLAPLQRHIMRKLPGVTASMAASALVRAGMQFPRM